MLRRFFNYLPLNNRAGVPERPSGDPAERLDPSRWTRWCRTTRTSPTTSRS
jgi:hypothetical protein